MSKLDWHHIIHLAHFLGLAFVMALPVSSILLWVTTKPGSNLQVAGKFADMLGRLDRVTQAGIAIMFVSGVGQIWAHGIGLGDIFTKQIWLGIKLILFAALVVNGVLFAGPGVRKRAQLLREVIAQGTPPTPDQERALKTSYQQSQIVGGVMIALLFGILFTVFFQPFTANPR